MAITVKFVRRRAGGRITVRPTTYDKRVLTIGRATDCDIFLPDLRVGLHHARFSVLGPRRALVEAIGDRRIKVGGASVGRREISLEQGDPIVIGPYEMTVELGRSDDDIDLTVELVAPMSAPAGMHEEEEVFSLRRAAPDKRVSAWLFSVFLLGLFLAFPIVGFYSGAAPPAGERADGSYSADRPWLTGDLSSAHANLVNDCTTCHEAAFVRVGDEVCLACHGGALNHALPDRLATSRPHAGGAAVWLKQVRDSLEIPEGRCGSCHFEHNGPEGVIPTGQALCTDCHVDLKARLADTHLLDVSDFSAHPEFRPTIVREARADDPIVERISLADRPRENSGLVFPHDFHLKDPEVLRKLETLPASERRRFDDAAGSGSGASMDCAGCHQLETGGALFAPIEMERNCAMCHSLVFAVTDAGERRTLPHGEPEEVARVLEDFYFAQASQLALADPEIGVLDRQLSAEARARRDRLRERAFAAAREDTGRMVARVFSEDGLCQKCHAVTSPGDGEAKTAFHVADVSLLDSFMPKAKFRHAAHMTGNIDCAVCHKSSTSSSASDVLMPTVESCRDCHGNAKSGGGIASGCLTCHVYHADDAPPMTAAKFHKAPRRRGPG